MKLVFVPFAVKLFFNRKRRKGRRKGRKEKTPNLYPAVVYKDGGIEALKHREPYRPQSELVSHKQSIEDEFRQRHWTMLAINVVIS